MSKKTLTWVVYWESGLPPLTTIPVDGTTTLLDRVLVNEDEVEDFGSDVTVLRVIGEYSWFVTNPSASIDRPYLHMAGMMARESLDTAVFTPALTTPEVVQEYPWSWLRTWSGIPDGVSSQGQHGMIDAITPGTALEKIDVRVKRKLKSGEQLVFSTSSKFTAFGSNALPANAELFLSSWLRVRILVES